MTMRMCAICGEPLSDDVVETDTCDSCAVQYDQCGLYFVLQ